MIRLDTTGCLHIERYPSVLIITWDTVLLVYKPRKWGHERFLKYLHFLKEFRLFFYPILGFIFEGLDVFENHFHRGGSRECYCNGALEETRDDKLVEGIAGATIRCGKRGIGVGSYLSHVDWRSQYMETEGWTASTQQRGKNLCNQKYMGGLGFLTPSTIVFFV